MFIKPSDNNTYLQLILNFTYFKINDKIKLF